MPIPYKQLEKYVEFLKAYQVTETPITNLVGLQLRVMAGIAREEEKVKLLEYELAIKQVDWDFSQRK
ncbi:hypothetical protein ACXQF3_000984 [Vibrio fluvialis]|uniref:hypothetical protein n=1 Tax=Vibrio fluvialis TaxID=676 RepID=UPI001C9D303B|nr:hypothetical protein [Vibrio fluvialis]EKO3436835.1 hypothetical protein [Vibrio fluvialis]MBY7937585.1 hypothetical protein [Vibrio fluvialis]MCE7581481.1 hypothetical protein [Vibrio fluvialis]